MSVKERLEECAKGYSMDYDYEEVQPLLSLIEAVEEWKTLQTTIPPSVDYEVQRVVVRNKMRAALRRVTG